jgi:hypothetical protein
MTSLTEREQTWSCNPHPKVCGPAPAWTRLLVLLAGLSGLWGCGGGPSSNPASNSSLLSGNWQFDFTAPSDGDFSGGLQGGFLLQDQGAISGQVIYSVLVPGSTAACAGSAPITGTLTGQNLSLTAMAAPQTFSLSGSVSADGSTLTGTYSTVATKDCGTAQSGLPFSARLVPPLTGSVQGYLHSTSSGPPTDPVVNQEFSVTGSLVQGSNTGANSAAVSGTLNFTAYPCVNTVSVTGQISGSSVILQLIAANGLNVGRIGTTPATSGLPAAVIFESSAAGGDILQGTNGYGISTSACPGNASSPGDVGNICLALGSGTACKQVLSLTPAFLTFPSQPLASVPTSQMVKITNTGTTTLDGLQLRPTANNFPPGDFNAVPSFSEADTCSSPPGSTFSLAPQHSCTLTMSFSPQESCPWQPVSVGAGLFAAPSRCPPFQPVRPVQVAAPPALAAAISLTCPSCPSTTSDANSVFTVPITGLGVSAIQPSTPELDFGAEDATLKEVSQPQTITFANQGNSAVQILPAMPMPPCGTPRQIVTLPRPASPGSVSGLQVVGSLPIPPTVVTGPTIQYVCDTDQQSQKPNFQIVQDDCSGTLLKPQESCSVSIVYAPQPSEAAGGLDYFLQLNTLQCTSTVTTDCEIDSGRFPVELKSGLASPLRVSPAASLNFGTWANGQTSYPPLTITLSNDKGVATPQAINFNAIVTNGDYTEIDDCPISLAPGGNCTMNITFTPKIVGFDQGSVTVTYSVGQNSGLEQVISLRGFGQ